MRVFTERPGGHDEHLLIDLDAILKRSSWTIRCARPMWLTPSAEGPWRSRRERTCPRPRRCGARPGHRICSVQSFPRFVSIAGRPWPISSAASRSVFFICSVRSRLIGARSLGAAEPKVDALLRVARSEGDELGVVGQFVEADRDRKAHHPRTRRTARSSRVQPRARGSRLSPKAARKPCGTAMQRSAS